MTTVGFDDVVPVTEEGHAQNLARPEGFEPPTY